MTDAKRLAARTKSSLPVVDELYRWAVSCDALPKSLTGKAVHYLIEQKAYLVNAFSDGRLVVCNI